MAFPVTLRRLSQMQPEQDGGNLLGGSYTSIAGELDAETVVATGLINGAAGLQLSGNANFQNNVQITGSIQAGSYIGLPAATVPVPLGIGPGTSPPARNLDVGHATNPQIRLTNTQNTFYTDLQAGPAGGFFILPTSLRTGINVASTPARALEVLDASSPQLRLTQLAGTQYCDFQVPVTGYLGILPSGGRVGIATATPNAALHINSPAPATVASGNGTDHIAAFFSSGSPGGNTTDTGNVRGGNGGSLSMSAGPGGTAPNAVGGSTGGQGAACTISAGAGGAANVAGTGINFGGAGGTVSTSAGAGGNASGVTSAQCKGGAGGSYQIFAGAGGSATNGTGTLTGGAGGAITIRAGQGGGGGAGVAAGLGGQVAIQGGPAAAIDGGQGGLFTFLAADGSSVGSGGQGGGATLRAGNGKGDNTASRSGGALTLTAGDSAGNQAGAPASIAAGKGGTSAAGAGVAGGACSVTGGAGGGGTIGPTTVTAGGSGAAANVTGGAGGAGTTTNGGGGAVNITGGAVGGGAGTGGTSGGVNIRAGAPGTGAAGVAALQNSGGTNRVAVNDTGLGFYAHAPIAQPSAAGSATGYAAGATTATFHSDDTYTGNVGSTGYTLNGVVAALKNLGLIAP